ncbi:MAG: hypothetical protein ACTSU5_01545 [Promethearchaeota archaeon]
MRRKTLSLMLLANLLAPLLYLPVATFCFSDYIMEADLVDEGLVGDEVEWEVSRSFGIFATYNLHAGSKVKWSVVDANETNVQYLVKQRSLSWFEEDWTNKSDPFLSTDEGIKWASGYNDTANITAFHSRNIYDATENSTDIMPFWYLITPKNWSGIARNVIHGYDNLSIWGSAASRLEHTNIYYKNEWVDGQYIDVLHLDVNIDDDNYDRLQFSRQEGVLLSRRISIQTNNTNGAEIRGDFHITMTDKTFVYTFSPWYFIILFAIIFGSILVAAVVISLLISRRKDRLRKLDY